jgi:nicotinate-nucleotide pyrophosphorylase (carboxylating)
VLAVIRHNARVLLSCERVILNLLQHMSGIATLARKYADAIQGTRARVLDTRKTVPGMRAFEKYAVLCGGGTNHRIDLASGILIKNNHISLGGGIAAVLKRALEQRQPGQRVQVEVRTPQELDEALAHGAEAILLDNMTPKEVKKSIERIKTIQPGRWIPTEASGGIVLDNIRAYAETGVDFISVGALTHSARAADISMSIAAEPGQESVRISRGFQGEGL